MARILKHVTYSFWAWVCLSLFPCLRGPDPLVFPSLARRQTRLGFLVARTRGRPPGRPWLVRWRCWPYERLSSESLFPVPFSLSYVNPGIIYISHSWSDFLSLFSSLMCWENPAYTLYSLLFIWESETLDSRVSCDIVLVLCLFIWGACYWIWGLILRLCLIFPLCLAFSWWVASVDSLFFTGTMLAFFLSGLWMHVWISGTSGLICPFSLSELRHWYLWYWYQCLITLVQSFFLWYWYQYAVFAVLWWLLVW